MAVFVSAVVVVTVAVFWYVCGKLIAPPNGNSGRTVWSTWYVVLALTDPSEQMIVPVASSFVQVAPLRVVVGLPTSAKRVGSMTSVTTTFAAWFGPRFFAEIV